MISNFAVNIRWGATFSILLAARRVVVELDGGQHDLAVAYDTRRTSWLESQGWTVLRFWNNEIDCNEEAVLEIILQELNRRSPSP